MPDAPGDHERRAAGDLHDALIVVRFEDHMDASGDQVQQLVAVGVTSHRCEGIGGQHRRPHPVAVGVRRRTPDHSRSDALRSACMATCVKLSRYDRSVRHEAVSPKASSDDRLDELYRATLGLMGSRPLYEVSMADVTAAAAVSKPLLYHYFSTRTELYVATSRWAADQLRGATRPDPTLPPLVCLQHSLNAPPGRRARTHEPDTSRTHRSPSPAAGPGRLFGHG